MRPATIVRLAQVMTLRFSGGEQAQSARDAVTLQHGAGPRPRSLRDVIISSAEAARSADRRP